MKVYIGQQKDILNKAIKFGLEWIEWKNIINENSTVFIKPNFTYPFYKKGVTTSPTFLEALISVLKERTNKIIVGESDGGLNAWKAEEAFKGHDLYKFVNRYGIKIKNLSLEPKEYIETKVLNKKIGIELPKFLLHEVDVFITVPVPKIHVMTGVTLAFKNQWGCLPGAKRIKHHSEFNYKIVAINKLLKTKIAIFDGKYFLNRTGPMDGDPIKKDLLIVADDIGAGSLVCCKIMGIEPENINHFRIAKNENMFPHSLEDIELNTPISPFITEKFYLKRNFLNYAALWAFNSSFGTKFFYLWPWTAKPLHKLLYLFKGKPKDLNISY